MRHIIVLNYITNGDNAKKTETPIVGRHALPESRLSSIPPEQPIPNPLIDIYNFS